MPLREIVRRKCRCDDDGRLRTPAGTEPHAAWKKSKSISAAGKIRIGDTQGTKRARAALPIRRARGAKIPGSPCGVGRGHSPGYSRVEVMPMSDVTRILSAIEQGDPSAVAQLLPLVYDEL